MCDHCEEHKKAKADANNDVTHTCGKDGDCGPDCKCVDGKCECSHPHKHDNAEKTEEIQDN